MKFELPPLPYAKSALEPHISARTVDIHYEGHHKGYLKKLRKAIEGKPEAERSLEELVCSTEGEVYNLAAQVWNHCFYWQSLRADGEREPRGALLSAVQRSFGSLGDCQRALAEAANGEFGSGWAWLVQDRSGRLHVRSSSDADNPVGTTHTPLLTIDVWEHAYYLDYQNARERYVRSVIDHLLDWGFAQENFERGLATANPKPETWRP